MSQEMTVRDRARRALRLWCRIVGHRDDWYDGPCCTRCGWHCLDDIATTGGSKGHD